MNTVFFCERFSRDLKIKGRVIKEINPFLAFWYVG